MTGRNGTDPAPLYTARVRFTMEMTVSVNNVPGAILEGKAHRYGDAYRHELVHYTAMQEQLLIALLQEPALLRHVVLRAAALKAVERLEEQYATRETTALPLAEQLAPVVARLPQAEQALLQQAAREGFIAEATELALYDSLTTALVDETVTVDGSPHPARLLPQGADRVEPGRRAA